MRLALVFLLCIIRIVSFSQSCGCSVTLSAGGDGGIYQPNLSSYAPGSVICISAGTYTYVSLGQIHGTTDSPIIIKNCGGQVVSNGTGGYGFRIVQSDHFVFTGTGDNAFTYGLKTQGISGRPAGISVMDQTTDYTIEYFEGQHVGVGIFTSKPPEDSNHTTWGNYFTARNLKYNHNYLHDTGGEAMYLGATSAYYIVYDYGPVLDTVEPILQHNVEIAYNVVDTSGWDGIQLASSPDSAYIHDNVVMYHGYDTVPIQQAGIIFGGKCSGAVYNNFIYSGSGNGLEIFGYNTVPVYNNVIVNTGWDSAAVKQDGVIVDARPQGLTPTSYINLKVNFVNNTIVNSGRDNIRFYNDSHTMAPNSQFINNYSVKPGAAHISFGDASVDTSYNLKLSTIASALFKDTTAEDYSLQADAPAVNAGTSTAAYGVYTDIDGVARPQGSAYDIGAYEYASPISLSFPCDMVMPVIDVREFLRFAQQKHKNQ